MLANKSLEGSSVAVLQGVSQLTLAVTGTHLYRHTRRIFPRTLFLTRYQYFWCRVAVEVLSVSGSISSEKTMVRSVLRATPV